MSIQHSEKRAVRALIKLQYDYTKLEELFYEEVHHLECKYEALYAPLFEKRKKIISGEEAPTDDDCRIPFDSSHNFLVPLGRSMNNPWEARGLRAFWLRTMRNVPTVEPLIQPQDEPILEHLVDIKVSHEVKPMTFTLQFFFNPNEYFENNVLEKKYGMRSTVSTKFLFSYEGPEIYMCSGCEISWKPGKDATRKKNTSEKQYGDESTIPCDSFFNFFKAPGTGVRESSLELHDDDVQKPLEQDFIVGHFIRERLISRAVLFFTGEAYKEESSDSDMDEL